LGKTSKELMAMSSGEPKEKASQFRQWHHGSPMLVLPNAWDAASARILEQSGCRAIATTSSGVAAALGYADGQRLSREMRINATARLTRVVACPVTADIEAGYGASIADVLETVKAIIEAGAVGINIEDSLPENEHRLVEVASQVELITAICELAASLDIPLVVNARIDVFLLAIGAPESRFEHAVQRANAYLHAGADCVYPIGTLNGAIIGDLVSAINGPINILGGPASPALAELAQLGVARVSLGGGLMRSVLGHLRAITRELVKQGTYTSLESEDLSGAEFQSLFAS